jgi:hypothetical protein
MQTDYTGSPAVLSLIEQTGLTKFIIFRIGNNKNSLPVYEHIDKSTIDACLNAFEKWAQIADNCLPYSMKLFNTKEDSDFNGEEVRNKAKGKVISFTFCLGKETSYQQQNQNQNQQIDVAQAIELALLKMQTKHNESALLQKLTDMENKISELENDDDDLDELDNASMGGLNSPAMLNLLGLLGKALGGKNAPAGTTINGLNDVKIANINKAVKILAKYDDQIDTDLLKLSSIAETNPDTFKMLIQSLRSM